MHFSIRKCLNLSRLTTTSKVWVDPKFLCVAVQFQRKIFKTDHDNLDCPVQCYFSYYWGMITWMSGLGLAQHLFCKGTPIWVGLPLLRQVAYQHIGINIAPLNTPETLFSFALDLVAKNLGEKCEVYYVYFLFVHVSTENLLRRLVLYWNVYYMYWNLCIPIVRFAAVVFVIHLSSLELVTVLLAALFS